MLSGDAIGEAHVLRFALDGHLKLSVFFPKPTPALLGTIITVENVLDHLPEGNPLDPEGLDPIIDAYWDNYFSWASNGNSIVINKRSEQIFQVECHDEIVGVFELTLTGPERYYLENKYSEQSKESAPFEGITIVKGDEPGTMFGLLPSGQWDYLPLDSVLVVRRPALEELVASASEVKPLAKRERDTLLVIIAALARIAKIDVSAPSSAASAIESETVRIRARVSDRTILNHLNRIPEALDARSMEGAEE